jgi:hypothetical protein
MPFPDFLISKQGTPFNQLGKKRFFHPVTTRKTLGQLWACSNCLW